MILYDDWFMSLDMRCAYINFDYGST